jgi:hypothetical protein
VPLNDVNTNLDLGLPEYKWGKDSYLPFNLQNVSQPVEPPPGEDDPNNPPPTDEAEKSTPFSKMLKWLGSVKAGPAPVKVKKPDTTVLWNAHVSSRRKTVKLMQGKVGKVLNQFRASTLAKLSEVHLEKFLVPADTQNRRAAVMLQTRGLVDLIFSHSAFGAALQAELSNPIMATLNLAGTELNAELGNDDPWQYPPQQAKEYLLSRTQPIMGVGGTVRDQLNTSLDQGLDAGETSAQLADRVKAVFNNLTSGEAKRVAQTETNMAYNNARHLAMTDAGIQYKAWLSSHGPNVREAHAIAEEQYIDAPIPVEEPFEVGGEQLMYPGDDSLGASAGNIINCQCIQLAAQKTGEDEETLTFKIFGVGVLTFNKKTS